MTDTFRMTVVYEATDIDDHGTTGTMALDILTERRAEMTDLPAALPKLAREIELGPNWLRDVTVTEVHY